MQCSLGQTLDRIPGGQPNQNPIGHRPARRIAAVECAVTRRVLLAINARKPRSIEAADRVAPLIERHAQLLGRVDVNGCELCTSAGNGDRPGQSGDRTPDLITVLGGDGTLLAAARCFAGQLSAEHEIPLLGINAGRVGFMAAFDVDGFAACAEEVLTAAALPTRALRMLSATHTAPKDDKPGPNGLHAVNEFVITAGPPYRMIALRLDIDGVPGPVVRGDGLIVSTPNGSTAYNVSAGGPIVAPGVEAVVIAPIAAHSLSFRPIVLPAWSRIDITVEQGNEEEGAAHGTTLVADGQLHRRLRTGDVISITGDGPRVRFVTNPAVPYWQTLMGKMRWAAAPKGHAENE